MITSIKKYISNQNSYVERVFSKTSIIPYSLQLQGINASIIVENRNQLILPLIKLCVYSENVIFIWVMYTRSNLVLFFRTIVSTYRKFFLCLQISFYL